MYLNVHNTTIGGNVIMNKNITVLVADDDDDFRAMLAEFLKERGFDVLEARDGQESINIAVEKTPDIILLDVMMPEKSGIDVCKELKADGRARNSIIIMLTVLNQLSDKLTAYMAGAQRYLIKGCDMTEVENCITTSIQQRDLNEVQMNADDTLS